ncbi:dienelactone hydrolase family protein [Candidatus Poriferisodalis sp.]|uniref:dienelactone hydrolase family protein n=1 Tax=Candidatus Poriferisodalis sp. TaxID=3101277 RepID=UPI003B0225F2
MHSEERELDAPDGKLGLYIVRPDGDGPFPLVMFFHHGPGFDAGSREAADAIADEGFCVAVPDRYWRNGPWLTFDIAALFAEGPDSPAMQEFLGLLLGTTDDLVDADIELVLAALEDDPAVDTVNVGCIGYCIGARTVVRALVGRGDTFVAGVGLHPSFCVTTEPDSPHLGVPTITGRLHMGQGTADQLASLEQNQPLLDAVAELGDRGSVDVIEGADHGFAVPGGHAYHAEGAARSYATALTMFSEHLGSRA